jgi:hypothetical protein
VHLDGRVTGTVEEVIIDRERADAIRSAPAALHQFVGRQVLEGQVTGALFAFILTLDAIGSPPIPALLLRRAQGVADREVVGWIDKVVRTLAGLGRRVTRVAIDGDRLLRRLLDPAWNAVQNQALWDFGLPSMAQERLFAAAMWSSGFVVLSDLHHLLKVLRYCALTKGILASLSSPGWLRAFTCESGTAVQFPKWCLRNEAAAKMDDELPAIFFDFENYGGISTAVQVAEQSFEAAWGAVLREAGGGMSP